MSDPWGAPGDPGPQPNQANYDPSQQGGFAAPPPGYPLPPAPPAPGGNGIALAGAIVSFIPVVGLILSIIGRVRAKALGGAGKTAGTVGIVLSVLFTGAAGFGVYKLANSTAADPACISAESDSRHLISTLSADESAMSTAEQNGDKSALTTAGNKFTSDIQSLSAQFAKDKAKATHDNVRTAISNFQNDLDAFAAGLQQLLNGDTSNQNATTAAGARLATDGNAVDNLCGNVTNG